MTAEAIEHIEDQIQLLTPQQALALPLLGAGQRYEEVAELVGVSCGTVRNWASSNTNFKAALYQIRRDLFTEANERLKALAFASTDALHLVLTDAKTSPRDRIAAARVVLGHVHDKTRTHHITSGEDAASMIAKILENTELS